MQQITYVEPHRVEARDAVAPRLGGDYEALVRPIAVATCDLDGAMIAGRTPFAGPFPLGHEGVAEVLDVADSVADVLPGQLVCVPFQVSCGTCAHCRRGHTAHCSGHGAKGDARAGAQMFGIGPTGAEWGGFLSDVVRIPFADHMLVPVPAGISPSTIASVSDNVCDGFRTVADPLKTWPGAPVLIVGGSGAIGPYAVLAALALGAERVDYLDTTTHWCHRAEQLGPDRSPSTQCGPSGSALIPLPWMPQERRRVSR